MKKLNLKKNLIKNIIDKDNKEREIERDKKFVDSGSYLHNLALTGNINKGYCIGRIVNIIADYSTGKSLFCCELINQVWHILHKQQNKKVLIIYDDTEATFDFELAEKFQMPIEHIIFEQSETVEEFEAKLWKHIKSNPECYIIVYILDSLDAIDSDSEAKKHQKNLDKKVKKLENEKDNTNKDDDVAGTYGTGKAKALSNMFKHLTRKLKTTNCLLIIVSQLRDDITVKYGNKSKRSGGRALDFYASQVFWIIRLEKIESLKYKIPQGMKVETFVSKNKIWKPLRKAKMTILYEYGIDNISSIIDFCIEYGAIKQKGAWYEYKEKSYHKEDLIKYFDKNEKEFKKLLEVTQEIWNELEKDAQVERLPKWKDG